MDKSFSGTILKSNKNNIVNTNNTQPVSQVCNSIIKMNPIRRKQKYFIPSQFPKII